MNMAPKHMLQAGLRCNATAILAARICNGAWHYAKVESMNLGFTASPVFRSILKIEIDKGELGKARDALESLTLKAKDRPQ